MYISLVIFLGSTSLVLGLFVYIVSSQTPNQTDESKKMNDIFAYVLIALGSLGLLGSFFMTKKQKFFPTGIPVTTFTKRLKPEITQI
jgi:heme/copper-type cytochrome/quinol oxidase subunit 1